MTDEESGPDDWKLWLGAFRKAARYRNPETGRRHFAHDPTYRKHFVLRILELRRRLKSRGAHE
jgi:hypothetical protein